MQKLCGSRSFSKSSIKFFCTQARSPFTFHDISFIVCSPLADADIFCLQETKLQEGQIDLKLPGYHPYWNYAEKKGYGFTDSFRYYYPDAEGIYSW